MPGNTPFISICIPAYKNLSYVSRLLNSIKGQTYKNFEVVISDDSPNEAIREILDEFSLPCTINYLKNNPALGSPANWNNAIKNAKGSWIKLMHDDDWFAQATSLETFANVAMHAKTEFIFSGFANVNESGQALPYCISWYEHLLLRKNPINLLKKNFIGHPSTTMVKSGAPLFYEDSLKWVVDIEYYIRLIKHLNKNFTAIRSPLINIGIGSEQITAAVFRKPEVEIPENIALLKSIGPSALKNIYAYDYFWRFIRNLKIRNTGFIGQYYKQGDTPILLQRMVNQQRLLPHRILSIGVLSKLFMFTTYLFNRIKRRIK